MYKQNYKNRTNGCVIAAAVIQIYLRNYPTNRTTVTEMLHKYKNYVVVEKYTHNDAYYIVLKNPYKWNQLHKHLNIASGIYYNYYVGDIIGTKKQTYFN